MLGGVPKGLRKGSKQRKREVVTSSKRGNPKGSFPRLGRGICVEAYYLPSPTRRTATIDNANSKRVGTSRNAGRDCAGSIGEPASGKGCAEDHPFPPREREAEARGKAHLQRDFKSSCKPWLCRSQRGTGHGQGSALPRSPPKKNASFPSGISWRLKFVPWYKIKERLNYGPIPLRPGKVKKNRGGEAEATYIEAKPLRRVNIWWKLYVGTILGAKFVKFFRYNPDYTDEENAEFK